ncbi:DUF3558 family protein [Rhodococcus spelaei]|uniref:DUF3558 family protein n=1 Tax=Rhodococcus spelaei TaxID=2546320 RepID=UPI0015EED19A|nr:DUF3558 family protein [Rhodococcus spelaei]
MHRAALSPLARTAIRAPRRGHRWRYIGVIGTFSGIVTVSSLLTGCSGDENRDAAAPTSTPVASGFRFAACASMTDAEVSQTTSLPSLTRVVQNPIGCRWEGSRSYVQAWWYRGSPLAVERTAAASANLEPTDLTVAGLAGFEAHSADDRVCEIVAAAGPDLIAWTVDIGDSARRGACDAATALTSSSVTRGVER